MKVKSLLKILCGVDYWLVSESGTGLENGYVSQIAGYDGLSAYEDYKVVRVRTDDTIMYITIK